MTAAHRYPPCGATGQNGMLFVKKQEAEPQSHAAPPPVIRLPSTVCGRIPARVQAVAPQNTLFGNRLLGALVNARSAIDTVIFTYNGDIFNLNCIGGAGISAESAGGAFVFVNLNDHH